MPVEHRGHPKPQNPKTPADVLKLNKMKIKASDLWPVVLHFIKEYLS
jgi:hypothetical protein